MRHCGVSICKKEVFIMKNYSILPAKTVLVSLAGRLPENLVIDTATNRGQLAMNFIMQLNKKQLSELSEAVSSIKETCFLEFFSVSEKDLGKVCPTEMKEDSVSLSTDAAKVLFNSQTCPIVQKGTAPSHYVSVTIVTKADE